MLIKNYFLIFVFFTSFLLSGCCVTNIMFTPEYRYQDIESENFRVNSFIHEDIELGQFIGGYPYRVIIQDDKPLPEGLSFKFYIKDEKGVPIYLKWNNQPGLLERVDADFERPIIFMEIAGKVSEPYESTLMVSTISLPTMCGKTDVYYRMKIKVD